MVVFRDPGAVPANWKLLLEQDVEQENLMSSSSLVAGNNSATASSSDVVERRPELGYCNRCQNGKPPRCHHCSVCKPFILLKKQIFIWVI